MNSRPATVKIKASQSSLDSLNRLQNLESILALVIPSQLVVQLVILPVGCG